MIKVPEEKKMHQSESSILVNFPLDTFASRLEPKISEAKQKEIEKLNKVNDTLINTGETKSSRPTKEKQN